MMSEESKESMSRVLEFGRRMGCAYLRYKHRIWMVLLSVVALRVTVPITLWGMGHSLKGQVNAVSRPH
jgi:hypothetical protein